MTSPPVPALGDGHPCTLDARETGLPFSKLAFADEYDRSIPLRSTFGNDVLGDLGVRVEEGQLRGTASRSVFVPGTDRTVEYARAADEPLTVPDLGAVAAAMESA